MSDMKVDKVGGSGRTDGAKKARKSGGSGEAFAEKLRETAESVGGGGADGVGSVAQVGSILSVQEVPDSTEGRSRGLLLKYGDELLDRLDDIRIGLLVGSIPKDDLAELARKMREKRHECDDPQLNELIEEIELRSEVEIAKLTRDV